MSINGILDSAVSSLHTYNAALQVTANNVANVNTPGFARREAQIQSQIVDGQVTGVEIGQIRRITDEFLQTEYINSSATAAYYESQAALHSRLQGLLGAPDSNVTLSARINEVFAKYLLSS